MTIQEIISEYKADSEIKEHSLDLESARTYQLHAKYLGYLADARSTLRSASKAEKMMYTKKELYYGGSAPAEVYKKAPFDRKIVKSDLYKWIEIDSEYQAVKDEVMKYEEIVECLVDIIKQLNGRGYAIKNIIDFLRFKNGVA